MNKKLFHGFFGSLAVLAFIGATAAETQAGWGSFGGGSWGSRGGSVGNRSGSLGHHGSRGGLFKGGLFRHHGSRGGALGSRGSWGSVGHRSAGYGSVGHRSSGYGSSGYGSAGHYPVHHGYSSNSHRITVHVAQRPTYTVPVQQVQRVHVSPPVVASEVVTSLTLSVPEDAKVELCGQPMTTTGKVRQFSTKELRAGQSWANYQIKITYMENDRLVSVSKTIKLSAGDAKHVEFKPQQRELVAVN